MVLPCTAKHATVQPSLKQLRLKVGCTASVACLVSPPSRISCVMATAAASDDGDGGSTVSAKGGLNVKKVQAKFKLPENGMLGSPVSKLFVDKFFMVGQATKIDDDTVSVGSTAVASDLASSAPGGVGTQGGRRDQCT